MKAPLTIITCFVLMQQTFAQTAFDSLFDIQTPLNLALTLSIKHVGKSKDDTSYIAHTLYYFNSAGVKDSIPIGLKARGNNRLSQCYFPPLWMNMQKKNTANTIFTGNKKVKVVLPCHNVNYTNELVLREYLCYKLYEVLTPYSFKTRLVDVQLTELRRKNNIKNFALKGVLIEDVDKTAKRCNAQTVKTPIHLETMNDTAALRFDLFQFMIANTDWSKIYQHNSKMIFQNPKFIPLPYDFDMCGLVDAPYAVVSVVNGQELPIQDVTERYYRGSCRPAVTTDFVRKEFLSKKEQLLAVPDILKDDLPAKEIKQIKEYLNEFFVIIEDDKLFQQDILNRCR